MLLGRPVGAGPPCSHGDFNRGCPSFRAFCERVGGVVGLIMTDTVGLRMTHRWPLPSIENHDGWGSQGAFRATRKGGPAPTKKPNSKEARQLAEQMRLYDPQLDKFGIRRATP